MRRNLLMVLLVLAPTVVSAQEVEHHSTWLQANNAFQSGDYVQAAASYQQLVDAGIASADVFYNLGTAELRAGRRGAAILAFERALRLAPGDSDAAFNLAEAQKGNVDKVVGVREEEPLLERVGARVPVGLLGPVFVGAWLLFWSALIARFFVKRGREALGWVAGGMALASLLTGVLVGIAAWQRSAATYAIVVAPESPIREGPAKNFKAAFDVHEGLKLRVMEREQEFLRVRLPNGIEGWILEKDAPLI